MQRSGEDVIAELWKVTCDLQDEDDFVNEEQKEVDVYRQQFICLSNEIIKM